MLDKELGWLDKFSRWQEQRRHVLFSLMKSMLSEEQDPMMVQEQITKFKGQC